MKRLLVPIFIWAIVLTGCGDEMYNDALTTSKDNSENRTTTYPLVFLHGFMGADKILGFDYFYKVKNTLINQGFEVYTPKVVALNSVVERGHDLALKIDAILEESGADKVNIIAHSMGGLDARYLISSLDFGDKIASLTTIGTPHKGTPLSTAILNGLGEGDNILYKAFEKLTAVITDTDPNKLDIVENLKVFEPKYMATVFNKENSNDNDVLYQSYGGITGIVGIRHKDVMSPLFLPFYPILANHGIQKHDGLVPLESSKWGIFRGVINADHLDQIGHFFGTSSPFFRYLKFYKNLARELSEEGL